MKPINQNLLFYVIITIGFGLFLINSYSSNNQLADVKTLLNPPQSIGHISIKNGSQKTIIYITNLKTESNNIDQTLQTITSDISSIAYQDSTLTFTPPIQINPNETKTINLKTASLPNLNSSLKISQITYQTGVTSSSYTQNTNLTLNINPLAKSLVAPSSFEAKQADSCQADASVVCNPNFTKNNSNIIKNIEKQTGQKDKDNQLITYIPTSKANWQSINANVRVGARYVDLALDVPEFIKPEIIYLPKQVSLSDKDKNKACSGGIDQTINQISSLTDQKNLLEFALSGPYNLPSLSIPSNKCIASPSYENGTFDDVFYYIPNGECQADLKIQIQKQLDQVNSDISQTKLALFNEGKIDDKNINKDVIKSLSEKDQLSITHKIASNCREAINNNANTDEAFKQNDKNLNKLYGNACEDSKKIYKQFNHKTDAPSVSNSIITTNITEVKYLDVNGCVEGKYIDLRDEIYDPKTHTYSYVLNGKKRCKKLYQFEVNGKSCIGYEGLQNCGYALTPIEDPISLVPLGYYKIGPELESLAGACTGVSNLVGYFFSNGKFTGGSCDQKLSEFPNRLQNQCFEVECNNFNKWFKEQIKDIDKSIYSEEFLYNQAVWEEIIGDTPDVCELITPLDFQNSIIYELGFNKNDSILLINFNFGLVEMNAGNDDKINKNLYNNINNPNSILKNRHFDILDDLINGYISNLSIILSQGGHEIFGYSCNQDSSINSFDPNIPSKKVRIYQKENGLWRIPDWNSYFTQRSEKDCISDLTKLKDLNKLNDENIKKMCKAQSKTGENVVITVNRTKYQQLGQCQEK